MDRQQVEKLAKLARISVPEEELDTIAADFGTILGFIDQISKVDIGTTANTEFEAVNVFRDDVVAPIDPAYNLVEAAPEHADGFVKVAKVIE